MKRLLPLFLLLLSLIWTPALSETARISTSSGGKVHMRKGPDARANIVVSVPDQAEVELLELGEEWSQVRYKGKTGYMRTEFLRYAAQLAGQVLYPDKGTLYLLTQPDEASQILYPLGPQEPVVVEQAEGEWAVVRYGEIRGFARVSAFSRQLTSPEEKNTWVRESGITVRAEALLLRPDTGAQAIGQIEAGEQVIVTEQTGEACLVITRLGCGYMKKDAILLQGQETEEAWQTCSPMEAIEAARTALSKAFKDFAKESLYYTTAAAQMRDGFAGPLYQCCFYSVEDQYRYTALVDAQSKKALFTADYTGFCVPQKQEEALLPYGQIELTASADSLCVGDVFSVQVQAWTKNAVQYVLSRDGAVVVSSETGAHFRAGYRPRQEGQYILQVLVTDEQGASAAAEVSFTVGPGASSVSPYQRVYSQKDGWWLDKAYRKSNLDKSGCAIFTLSAALQRLGFTGEDILPEQLAKTFALCLTDTGTNNERLLREAGQKYGYSFKDKVTDKPDFVKSKLQEGAMFSFSVARGHIALIDGISADGTMVHVADSAPTATFTRIVGDSLYYEKRPGIFVPAMSLEDLPGALWYFETDQYGGLEYWMRTSYAAGRGVRLIQGQAGQ